MSTNLRTVRLLDREPGKATETRVVSGTTVERGIPLPPPSACLGDVMAALEVGESFVHSFLLRPHQYKRLAGKQFTQRKIGPRQYRIWRTK